MIYTKYNIDGLKFYIAGFRDEIYLMTLNSRGVIVSWKHGTKSSHMYSFDSCIEHLNRKEWIEVKVNNDYEIY